MDATMYFINCRNCVLLVLVDCTHLLKKKRSEWNIYFVCVFYIKHTQLMVITQRKSYIFQITIIK